MFQTVKGFLHTQGTIIVNEDGQEVLLRGMGDAVHFTFDGKVAHVFSKETEKNLEF